jgi:uncharacterized protein (DUF1499 family)
MNVHHDAMKHSFTSHSSDGAALTYLAPAGLALAVLAGIAAAVAGLGSRWGWWYFTTGFMILRWSAIAGAVAAVISLAGGIISRPGTRRSGFYLAVGGIVIGLAVAGIPWSWMRTAQQLPRIHDITTDPANPPLFVKVLPLRKDAPNPAEYGGPNIAAQQAAAYPDVGPLLLPAPPNAVFEKALKAVRKSGWQIVDANAAEGRIEATATTLWFGFKDDVVVRITPVRGGSRVDVRSVSRVGLSDVGTNARRIRAYLHDLSRMSLG